MANANLNQVFLAGNLTRDPEIRYIPSGKAVADLGLAVNRRYKTSSGEDKEETCFVDITVWDRQAEAVGKYLKKGSSVLVEGRLKFEQWESDGGKRSKLSVIASRVQFLDKPEPRNPGGEGDAEQSQPPNLKDQPENSDEDNLPF